MTWRTFYSAYFDRLWRYLLVIAAGHEDAAREALQGTLVRVTRHIKVFRDENVFWSWLTVLARSALADETKKTAAIFRFWTVSRGRRALNSMAPTSARRMSV